METGSEKRKNQRSQFLQSIALQRINQPAEDQVLLEHVSRGIDISPQGLGLITRLALREGEIVKIKVQSKAEGVFLPIFSRVVWTKKDKNGFRVGFRFLS